MSFPKNFLYTQAVLYTTYVESNCALGKSVLRYVQSAMCSSGTVVKLYLEPLPGSLPVGIYFVTWGFPLAGEPLRRHNPSSVHVSCVYPHSVSKQLKTAVCRDGFQIFTLVYYANFRSLK